MEKSSLSYPWDRVNVTSDIDNTATAQFNTSQIAAGSVQAEASKYLFFRVRHGEERPNAHFCI